MELTNHDKLALAVLRHAGNRQTSVDFLSDGEIYLRSREASESEWYNHGTFSNVLEVEESLEARRTAEYDAA